MAKLRRLLRRLVQVLALGCSPLAPKPVKQAIQLRVRASLELCACTPDILHMHFACHCDSTDWQWSATEVAERPELAHPGP